MSVYSDWSCNVGNAGEPPLTVRLWPEADGYVAITAAGEDAKEWYGQIDLPISLEFARALAHALLEIADHVEGNQ